jgi:hypothetical protein
MTAHPSGSSLNTTTSGRRLSPRWQDAAAEAVAGFVNCIQKGSGLAEIAKEN